jgi:hypothetical protein
MKVQSSHVPGVGIFGQDSPEFSAALESISRGAPKSLLEPALPFSVIVANDSRRGIALLGVRFDLVEPRGKKYSVVHYADTLRDPEHAEFQPGTKRFVCAEPAYTGTALRGEAAAVGTTGRLNLENLRGMLQIRASLDCLAFDDGEFTGPDSLNAFERFAGERESETTFLTEAMATEEPPEAFLDRTIQESRERIVRTAARKLLECLESGSREVLLQCARGYRRRIPLHRARP